MKQIIMFETYDGKRFDTVVEATKHEVIQKKVDEIVNILGGKRIDINSSDFANGGGYYTIAESDWEKANLLVDNLRKELKIPEK